MFRISCFADEISPDINEQVRVMKSLGIKYVEFRSVWDKNAIDLDDNELAKVKKVFDENGISVSSIGSPIGKVDIDSDFEEHIGKFNRAIELAHLFGTNYIRIFSFYHKDKTLKECREKVMERLKVLLDIAKREGIILCHENEADIYGQQSDECKDILETINDNNFRAVHDSSNYVIAGEHPFDALKKIHKYIEYVHIKDSIFGGEIVPAGKGDGQVREVLEFLRYHDGMFTTLEPHLVLAGSMRGFSGEELFTIAYRALTDLLKELGIEYC
ncbi:MAG: sugar phosphate isomerase/epimerase [Clostridiales bacterium]|nr:sugar phosphate isomerase/epimerase [Clostridiales bacterium]